MSLFLEKIADRLLSNSDVKMEDMCVVLPNHRSILFLKHHLSKKIDTPIFLPRFFAMEDFMEHLSGLQVVESVSLQFQLYQSYLFSPPKKADTFDEFLRWSRILLNDFNEIDKNLIDSKMIFNNLKNVKELENWSVEDWSFSEEELSLEQNNFLSFYQKIDLWYSHFHQELLVQGIAYQGMAYKRAALNISSNNLSYKEVWFVGLDYLSKSEIAVIDYFKKERVAFVFWDTDSFYLNNPLHEAGNLLKNHISLLGNDLHEKEDSFNKKKDIFQIIACAKNIAQTKAAGQILNELNNKEAQNHTTAVVLANEDLLFPILYQIPSKIRKLNVSIGSPLENAPIFQFFDSIFNMQINCNENKKQSFYYKDVISFLDSPYTSQLIQSDELFDFKKYIIENNQVYVSKRDFNKHIDESLYKAFNIWTNPQQAIESCKLIIENLRKSIVTKNASVESEMLYQLSRTFVLIEKNINEYCFNIELKTIHTLFKEIVSKQKVIFSGEPLNGLQVMGISETRGLDFKNIIIVGLNEGSLPKGRSQNSFIPYDIKRYFELPTYLTQDAISSYRFYRLLQRASNISLIYNTETDSFGSGEKSRFITQIEREYVKGNLHSFIYQGSAFSIAKDQKIIVKNKGLESIIKQWSENKVSPSSLNRYVNCSLSFYFFYLAKIYRDNEMEEFTDASTFGNIIHKALYKHYPQEDLSLKNLNDAQSKILNSIEMQFQKKFGKTNINEGKNYLILQIALSLTESFLKEERRRLKKVISQGDTLNIVAKEKKVEVVKILEENTFRLYGKIDRIDQLNELYRIIDYKTGKVDSSELSFKNWEDLIENPNKSKAFQLLMYAYLCLNSTEFSHVNKIISGNFSFKNNKKGLLNVLNTVNGNKKEPMLIDKNVLFDFENQLDRLLLRITKEDFVQTEDKNRCKWCEYKNICNR